MPSYAELLGIDLDKLKAERHREYKPPAPKYSRKAINPPPESSDDWQKLVNAAKAVNRSIEKLLRWVKSDFVMAKKQKTAIYVYMPDVKRHAGKR
jgi:hypothetical protein